MIEAELINQTMKRPIKFRAWNGEKIYYPDTKTPDDNFTCLRFFNHPDSIGWGLYDYIFENRLCSGEYDQLMQFTGLIDKKGVDIYEGDIVQWVTDSDEGSAKVNKVVEYMAGAFQIVASMPPDEFEIIGNIFENPELINQ